MPPFQNQNGYQAPPPQNTRYDFFLDPAKPPKKSLIPAGNSKAIKFLLIVFGVVALFVATIVLFSVLSGNKGASDLTKVVIDQHEIARVSELGAKQVGSQSLKNFAANANTTATSAKQETLDYLAKAGTKVEDKQLIAAQDGKIDQALTAAQGSGTFETTFRSTMQALLARYQTNIKAAQGASTVKAERDLLAKYSASAELLNAQLAK